MKINTLQKWGCIGIILFFTQQAFAGFTLSGSTITQSGTDTSIDGLASIPGVTTINTGYIKIYNLGSLNLVFDGTVTDPNPRFVTNGRIVFTSNSNVTFGEKSNGVIKTRSLLIEGNFASTQGDSTGTGAWEFQNGSDVKIYGGRLGFGGTSRFAPSSVVLIEGSDLYPSVLSPTTGGKFRCFAENSGSTSIINCRNYGMLFDLFRTVTLDGTTHIGADYGFQTVSSQYLGTDDEFLIKGFDILEKTGPYDIDNYNNADLKLLNVVRGSEITVSNGGNNTDAVQARMYKELNVKLIDDNGNVEGAYVFIKDNDNGNRPITTKSVNSGIAFDFTNTQKYSLVTNSNGTLNSDAEILTAFYYKNGSTLKIDRRGKTNIAGEDTFDIHFWSYIHQYKYYEQILKGIGVLTIADKLFFDNYITEPTQATVDAYTTIDNLDMLYDRAKSWKVNSTNLEYPTETTPLIVANGEKLDLGSLNLVIDASASNAFSVDQNTHTLTIKSGALVRGTVFSSIKTTGTITLQNSAVLESGYIDSSGTYIYTELTNLNQQDILITDQQNPSSPVTIINVTNQTGTYKTHFALPTGGEINVLVEREGYAPWTETLPNGELNFIREVTTSLSSITGANQILTIDLLIKLLQKTEAVLNSVNTQGLPVPAVNVTTNTTSSTGPPSVDNQNVELGILTNILAKLTAIRNAIE